MGGETIGEPSEIDPAVQGSRLKWLSNDPVMANYQGTVFRAVLNKTIDRKK